VSGNVYIMISNLQLIILAINSLEFLVCLLQMVGKIILQAIRIIDPFPSSVYS